MAPSVSTTRPAPWVKQTDTGAPTEGKDCGPRGTLNVLLWATRNLVGPKTRGAAQRSWTALIRKAMKRPGKVATSVDDWRTALLSSVVARLCMEHGLKPPSVKRLSGAEWGDVADHLAAGRAVMAGIDYGTLIDGKDAPVGSRTFRDGHCVVWAGYALDENGWVWSCVFDSLLGSVRVVRLRWYRDAAGDFGTRPWGRGRLEGISVGRAQRLETEPKPPAPAPVTVDELKAIAVRYGEATEALDAIIERMGG